MALGHTCGRTVRLLTSSLLQAFSSILCLVFIALLSDSDYALVSFNWKACFNETYVFLLLLLFVCCSHYPPQTSIFEFLLLFAGICHWFGGFFFFSISDPVWVCFCLMFSGFALSISSKFVCLVVPFFVCIWEVGSEDFVWVQWNVFL